MKKNQFAAFDYQVKDTSDDPTAIRIQKSGITHDFLIADMLSEQEQLKRYIREFKGQRDLEQAKIENIKTFYPFVRKLTPKQLFAAKMMFDAGEIVRQAEEKLPEMEEQLAGSIAELAHISKTLGITVPTKEEVVEKAVANITEHGKK